METVRNGQWGRVEGGGREIVGEDRMITFFKIFAWLRAGKLGVMLNVRGVTSIQIFSIENSQ